MDRSAGPSEACRVNAQRERDQLRTRTMLCTRVGIGQVFRDLEMKRGAAPEGAGGPDASAVSLDDALEMGQAEARARTGCTIGLPESLEDVRKVVFRDAVARVLDGKLHGAVSIHPAHHNLPSGIREFQRSAEEIREYLQEPVAVREHRLHVVRYFRAQGDVHGEGLWLTKLDGLMEQRARVDALLADREGAGLDPRHVEQGGNQTAHAAGCALD